VNRRLPPLCLLAGVALLGALPDAAEPVRYTFSFPEPERNWMQVEIALGELASSPLELRMSRASPGRYSLHEFARGVFDVTAESPDGRELPITRPDPYGWTIADHGGSVRVVYRIAGDRLDGTYLDVDAGHAHINMPAALLWARGLDERPVSVRLTQPPGRSWHAATQLHVAAAPGEFTAPNLQYLMDSPIEFGPIEIRQFAVADRLFRVALHDASDAPMEPFVAAVERIVREEGAVFGEYPAYEPGYYTFLADYLPSADRDAMEHRNSAVLTSSREIATDRVELLEGVAHEFFHTWNVERIRPRSLEPFDFERANRSGELWLAEGFTQYYGRLILSRAGITDLASTTRLLGASVAAMHRDSTPLSRSAEEVSLLAPLIDGVPIASRLSPPVVSYYDFGAAVAMALDLALRERSSGRVTLDHYMRAMWQTHGRPGGAREGYVDRPYTMADAEARLAEVSGDPAFARDFFARYIQGRERPDYERLLRSAGLVLRQQSSIVPAESTGAAPTPAQTALRDRWLGPAQ
jgi:predicted metalloprotease with PDZ domain